MWTIQSTRSRFVADYDNLQQTYVILSDGTPALRSWHTNNYEDMTQESLDGKKMDVPKNQSVLQGAGLVGPWNEEKSDDSSISESRIELLSVNRQSAYWYFVSEGKARDNGYFVGYDQRTNRQIGFIGLRGYSETELAQTDFFPVDRRRARNYPGNRYLARNNGLFLEYPNSDYSEFYPGYYPLWSESQKMFVSGDRLYKIDLEKRTVKTLLKSPDIVAINTAMDSPALQDMKDGNPYARSLLIALRTPDKIRTFDAEGKQLEEFAIPESLRAKPFVFYKLASDKAILRSLVGNESEKLQWIDAAGKIVREETIPRLNRFIKSFTAGDCWEAAGACPVLLGQALFYGVSPIGNAEDGEDYQYWSELKRSLAIGWLPLSAVVVLSALLAYFCYRWQRRYALPHTGLWVAFVFLCGVPGLLGYLFHRRWAVLDECPACKKKVPRDREGCASCGKDFPPPERKGIEVFA
jgi:hypothetical protein